MDVSSFLRSYCRSPLGISSFFVAVGVGASSCLLGFSAILSIVLGLGSFSAIVILSLALGFAQAAAVAESDRTEAEKARSRLAQADDARKRLVSLRLSEPGLASARDLVVLEAGKLVEDCSRRGVYDPEAVQAVLDSVELVDAYLKEADESSTERRFSMPEAHPFPEAASRAAQALREKATLIAKRREEATGEIPGADRIAIEEELK
jgi:hypothetical protein